MTAGGCARGPHKWKPSTNWTCSSSSTRSICAAARAGAPAEARQLRGEWAAVHAAPVALRSHLPHQHETATPTAQLFHDVDVLERADLSARRRSIKQRRSITRKRSVLR
eukprot:28089-Prymnesium_polylepis.2